MSSDTIIAGLKQGNAIELELVKKLKEGLGFIANGMQNECFNRSDALSELRDKLQEVSTSRVMLEASTDFREGERHECHDSRMEIKNRQQHCSFDSMRPKRPFQKPPVSLRWTSETEQRTRS